MYTKHALQVCLYLILAMALSAQPAEQWIKLVVGADHPDWNYRPGEKVKFSVAVYKNGVLLPNVRMRYEVEPEKQPPLKQDSLVLAKGEGTIDGVTLRAPGFLRCIAVATVEGKEYRNLCTAAFDPLQIAPTETEPLDFDQFWQDAKTELARVPLDAKMTLLPERCTEKVNVYQVNIQNFRIGARLYGILCVPKKAGKYPALLEVPGAGVRPYNGDLLMAEKGIITLQIGIHGIPVTMDPGVYADLANGVLNNY